MNAQQYAGAIEAVERILNREAEPDQVLRQAVTVLHDRIGSYAWVGLSFVEDGELVLGPVAGTDSAGATIETPVVYNHMHVATLVVRTDEPTAQDAPFLERVAVLISAHCLVAWDTGGVPWT